MRVVAVVLAVGILWIAWGIGRFLLRILIGLSFLGLVAFLIWYLLGR
jgi:hypothetical protein